jgi:YggT family protein
MNDFLINVAELLIKVAFGIYIFAVLLRLLLQFARADFYNPLSQGLVRFTNPLVRPLRRVIPGLLGIDWASVVLLLALQFLELWLLSLLGPGLPLQYLLLRAVVQLIYFTINVYIIAIIVRALLSWVVPYGAHQNPAGGLLISLTEPLLRPARRVLPPLSGFDVSPIVVLVVLWIVQMALDQLLR